MTRKARALLCYGIFMVVLAGCQKSAQSHSDESLKIDGASIKSEILKAYASGRKSITIPPGTYRIAPGDGDEYHLSFSRLKDFEINASGVTFIFSDRSKSSILFDECSNVTLKGATLVREISPISQGEITAISKDRKYLDIKISQGYPADLDDNRYFPGIPIVSIHDRGVQGAVKRNSSANYPRKIERLGPDSFRMWLRRPIDPRSSEAVGDIAAFRSRVLFDIHLLYCSGMRLSNVTVKGGAGMCVREDGGDGGGVYNYAITYGPRPQGALLDPYLSSNADGYHGNMVRKGPVFEGCLFEGTDDDAIAIHGLYGFVHEGAGNVVVADMRLNIAGPFSDPSWNPNLRKGDLLRFYDENGILSGEARITSFQQRSDYSPPHAVPAANRCFQDPAKGRFYEIELDRPISVGFGWHIANADALGSGYAVRNCTIRDLRGRGVIAKADNGVIERNRIERTSNPAVFLCPEIEGWAESDYSQNVVVENNHFGDCARMFFPLDPNAGAVTVGAFEHGGFVRNPGGHRNIVVRGNTFEDQMGVNLLVTSAQGVRIEDNHFIRPMTEGTDRGSNAKVDQDVLMWLAECDDVVIRKNTISDPGQFLKRPVFVGSNASDVTQEENIFTTK
ncbi:hypothetical protein DB345_05975 [Spartobacteria bacterium LR76]|nr:hypothetical protein DB345_05975 [Spartobacteria bacterium LR76]